MECEFRWLCGCLLLRPPRAYFNVAVNWTVDPSWVNCVSCRKNDQRGSMEFRRLGPKEGVGVLGEGRAANPLPPVRWVGERFPAYILAASAGFVAEPRSLNDPSVVWGLQAAQTATLLRLNSCRSPQSGSKLNCANPPPWGTGNYTSKEVINCSTWGSTTLTPRQLAPCYTVSKKYVGHILNESAYDIACDVATASLCQRLVSTADKTGNSVWQSTEARD